LYSEAVRMGITENHRLTEPISRIEAAHMVLKGVTFKDD